MGCGLSRKKKTQETVDSLNNLQKEPVDEPVTLLDIIDNVGDIVENVGEVLQDVGEVVEDVQEVANTGLELDGDMTLNDIADQVLDQVGDVTISDLLEQAADVAELVENN